MAAWYGVGRIHFDKEDITKPRSAYSVAGALLRGGGPCGERLFRPRFAQDATVMRGKRNPAEECQSGRNVRGRNFTKIFPPLNAPAQKNNRNALIVVIRSAVPRTVVALLVCRS